MKKIALLFLAIFMAVAPLAEAASLAHNFAGKLVLVVDKAGELWYVAPDALSTKYLGKTDEFLASMRTVALGISEKDLSTFNGQAPARLAGRFLLRTEAGGKIAYVNPTDLKIHFFDSQAEAVSHLTALATGVKQSDLAQIQANREAAVAGIKVTATAKANIKAPAKSAPVKDLSADKAAAAAKEFIVRELVEAGTKVTVKVEGKIDGLYKLKISVGDNNAISGAISLDGKRFYPQIMDVTPAKNVSTPTAPVAPAPTTSVKNDKPVVELFVMSHCPYGTQSEKGILPVVKTLGSKIDFQLKFVDYAMHGEKEVKEQLNQYCIQKEEPAKLIGYLECFLEAGDGSACLAKVGINTEKLTACQAQAEAAYKITANLNDRSVWNGSFPPFNIYQTENQKYGVQGSPTLVINGQTISSARDSASLAKTICAAFNTPPAECQQAFSSATPAPGFGYNTTTNNSAASCN